MKGSLIMIVKSILIVRASIEWLIFERVFGFPLKHKEGVFKASAGLNSCMIKRLLQDPHTSNVSQSEITKTKRHL